MEVVLILLIIQGVIGAFDTLVLHEWQERLPYRESAVMELRLHALRALLYGVIFIGLAWLHWQGAWAWVFIAVLMAEVVLTAWDFIVEDQTRRLSPIERVTHLILAVIFGGFLALLAPHLMAWTSMPTGLVNADYGYLSWMSTLLGMGAATWGVRDGIAGMRYPLPDSQ